MEAALDPGLSHWSRTAAKMNAMSGNTLPTWYFAEFEPVGVAQTLQQLRVPGRIGTGRLREHALLYAPTGCRPKARRRMRLTLEPSRNSKLDSAVRGPRPRPPGKGAPRQPGLVHSSCTQCQHRRPLTRPATVWTANIRGFAGICLGQLPTRRGEDRLQFLGRAEQVVPPGRHELQMPHARRTCPGSRPGRGCRRDTGAGLGWSSRTD